MNSLIPLPWERLLWTGRPLGPSRWLAGERYVLTDFRVVRAGRGRLDEMALDDVAEIVRVESRSDRLLGTSTVVGGPATPWLHAANMAGQV